MNALFKWVWSVVNWRVSFGLPDEFTLPLWAWVLLVVAIISITALIAKTIKKLG
jgi:hypothetical protein